MSTCPNRNLSVLLAITLTSAGLSGCVSAPTVREMDASRECHVWYEGAMSLGAARVVDLRARVYGPFGVNDDAYWTTPGTPQVDLTVDRSSLTSNLTTLDGAVSTRRLGDSR